jgi:glycosyltransferase involved in cell wall biosynthesis
VIKNGFDPADLEALPSRGPIGGRPVRFLYAGRLLNQQSVGAFWRSFGELASRPGRPMRMQLLGWIEPDQLEEARRHIGPNLEATESVPHRVALEAMARADVLVVVTEGGGAGPGTMTGKLYECLALRRPILLIGPPGDAAELVLRANAGVAVEPSDSAGMEEAIREVADLARSREFEGAPEEFLRQFDRRHLAAEWAKLLGDVAISAGIPAAHSPQRAPTVRD